MRSLHEITFTSKFVDRLPIERAYSIVAPGPVSRPRLVAWLDAVAGELGLARPDDRDLAILAGNLVPERVRPFAARYGGHQFGHWAGQLGDGRAISLGEVNGLEIQLKGAGPTPYSRRADGRAVLRSSLREFVCSEAMHHLGVPTTRALALIATGDEVLRDMFYDGRPALEPGAICVRVAPSFVRFGNFEIFAADGDVENLRRLAAFVIESYYPELQSGDLVGLFAAVVERTARMVSAWMSKGFVHGVMNTDNMSVLGLTIDYGPYGWLEEYDPSWTPNTTDLPGRRYAYARQPEIAHWNLAQFGSALGSIDEEIIPELRRVLESFASRYLRANAENFAAKLGLLDFADAADRALFGELDQLMRDSGADFTCTYRELISVDLDLAEFLNRTLYRPPTPELETRWARWRDAYRRRSANLDPATRRNVMTTANPRFVPRNYLLKTAIDRATAGDFAAVTELLDVFRRPFDEQPGREAFAARRPEWARHSPGCSTLSCSS